MSPLHRRNKRRHDLPFLPFLTLLLSQEHCASAAKTHRLVVWRMMRVQDVIADKHATCALKMTSKQCFYARGKLLRTDVSEGMDSCQAGVKRGVGLPTQHVRYGSTGSMNRAHFSQRLIGKDTTMQQMTNVLLRVRKPYVRGRRHFVFRQRRINCFGQRIQRLLVLALTFSHDATSFLGTP